MNELQEIAQNEASIYLLNRPYIRNGSLMQYEVGTAYEHAFIAGHNAHPSHEVKRPLTYDELGERRKLDIYPIVGFAPGSYMCHCSTCDKNFFGDKRAVQCEPCAIKTLKEAAEDATVKLARLRERIETLEKQAAFKYTTEEGIEDVEDAKRSFLQLCPPIEYGESFDAAAVWRVLNDLSPGKDDLTF